MPHARAISKGLLWTLTALVFCTTGITVDRFYLAQRGQSRLNVEKTDLIVDTNSTQLIVTTLTRKHEVIAVPLYTISLRDKDSGIELPLLTLEQTFQEPGIEPHLVDHDDETATFTAGKGSIKIHLPKIEIEGLSGESVYRGPPKQ